MGDVPLMLPLIAPLAPVPGVPPCIVPAGVPVDPESDGLDVLAPRGAVVVAALEPGLVVALVLLDVSALLAGVGALLQAVNVRASMVAKPALRTMLVIVKLIVFVIVFSWLIMCCPRGVAKRADLLVIAQHAFVLPGDQRFDVDG
jgi:hypothetical protein